MRHPRRNLAMQISRFMLSQAVAAAPIVMALMMVAGRSPANGQRIDSPQSRMRPLGSASMVDQYRRGGTTNASPNSQISRDSGQSVLVRETGYRNLGPVRQTVMQMQVPEGPFPQSAPTQGLASPPGTFAPPAMALPQTQIPQTQIPPAQFPAAQFPSPAAPRTLPSPNALPSGALTAPVASDLQPLRQPVLSNQFATLDNCACVSGPSGYSAASPSGCAPVNYQTPGTLFPYTAPPAQIPAPATMPGGVLQPSTFPGIGTSVPAAGTAAPAGSLLTFGQEQNLVQVGQGLLGQPKAYVPGQYFRNWLRYFTP